MVFSYQFCNVWLPKISIPPPPNQGDWKFLGVGMFKTTKKKKKCTKLNWNFQRDG